MPSDCMNPAEAVIHVGYSQNYGPLCVVDYITAPNA